jgi:hypothetical protein
VPEMGFGWPEKKYFGSVKKLKQNLPRKVEKWEKK